MTEDHEALLARVEADIDPLHEWVPGFCDDIRALLVLARRGAAAKELVEAVANLFVGGFIDSGTRYPDQFGEELGNRLVPIRQALAAYTAATQSTEAERGISSRALSPSIPRGGGKAAGGPIHDAGPEQTEWPDDAALEREARQISAVRMGLLKDTEGLKLPYELWSQSIPQARAALLAAGPPRRQPEWRPIETAPKDGTGFIVYREDAGVFSAFWNYPPHEDGGLDWDSEPFLCSVDGEDLTSLPPTHWMPIPAPPGCDSIPYPPKGKRVVSDKDVERAAKAHDPELWRAAGHNPENNSLWAFKSLRKMRAALEEFVNGGEG